MFNDCSYLCDDFIINDTPDGRLQSIRDRLMRLNNEEEQNEDEATSLKAAGKMTL